MPFENILLSTVAATAIGTMAGAWLALAQGASFKLGFEPVAALSVLSLLEDCMAITHFDDTKFTSSIVFSILLLVPIVSSISTATVKLTSGDGDEFAFVLASECMQNLVFIYFCATAHLGAYATTWLIFGGIQGMKSFLLFAGHGSQPTLKYSNFVTGERKWKAIFECLRSVLMIAIIGGVITYSPLVCEGEEEIYNAQRYTYSHLLTTGFLWSLGEYALRGGSMLSNIRKMNRGFIDHFVLGTACIYPVGYFVYHLQLGVNRFFTPFMEPTVCNVAGTLVDLVYIFPFTAIIAGVVSYVISFVVFAFGCFRDEDDDEDEEQSLLQSLTPVAMRAYVLIQLVLLAPFGTFALVKWEPVNGDLFSEYWCTDTPLLSAQSDWSAVVDPFNFTALQVAVTSTVEDIPRQAFLAPWVVISASSMIDLPKRSFFVKCYPTPQRWFEAMSNLFSRELPVEFAEIQRSYEDHDVWNAIEGVDELRHFVDYTCAAPTQEANSNQVSFCGTRCLLGTYLDSFGCSMGSLHALSCSCCMVKTETGAKIRNPHLDEASEFLCNECCESGMPRSGRLIEKLDVDDPIQQLHLLDDSWVVDKGIIGSDLPLTPKDPWWWVDPFGLWAAYALMLMVAIPEMSPVAVATSILIWGFYMTAAYSKEVAFMVQLALTLVADPRGANFMDSIVHPDGGAPPHHVELQDHVELQA